MTEAKIFKISEMDWTELGPGHYDKAMVTDEKTGMIVNVSKYGKGYKMGPHTHTCAHGILVLEGRMETSIGTVHAGEFVWFPAGVVMDHGAPEDEECTFLFITNAPFDLQRVEEEG